MTDEEQRLQELLGRYDRLRREGKSPSVEELCRDNPHLIDQLRRRIAELDEMQWLEDESSLPDDDDSLVPARGDVAKGNHRTATGGGAATEHDSMGTEEFVARLRVSGLLADTSRASRIEQILKTSPPSSAAELAESLVTQKLLTRFQCERILAQPRPQLVFGEYELTGSIGSGGMGEVFACRHGLLGQTYALKLLRVVDHQSSIRQRRFLQEIRSVAKLDGHRHIVGARGGGVQDGIMYFVMTLVEGEDLETRVEREGGLPLDQVVDIIRQAAQGLCHAHERQILHRDIKPANLLIEPTGNVRILDFGLARHREETERLTQAGRGAGTVAYMSPEQFRDMSSVDERADIYSLGCTLHRLLTGDEMYRARTSADFEVAHTERPIPDLRQRVPEAPDRLQQIFRRMVAKRPDDRYPNVRELLVDLEQVGRELGAPQSAVDVQDAGKRRSWRQVASNPGLLLGAAVVLVALAAAWLNRLPRERSGTLDLSGKSVGRLSLQWTLARVASPPRVLDLSNTGLPAGGLRPLRPYTDAYSDELTELYLGGTRIGDDDLKIVGDFHALRVLTLDHTQVGGSGLKHLARLRNLKLLLVPTDAVLDAEGQPREGWQALLESAGADGERELIELGLAGGVVGSETLNALRPLGSLRMLTIAGAEIDWGAETLSGPTELARSLGGLKNLRVLRFHNCRSMNDEALAKLTDQCPRLRITRDR